MWLTRLYVAGMQLKHNSRTVNVELFELASCVFAICFVRTVSFAQLRVPCRSLDWRLGAFGTNFFWYFESSSGDSSNLAGLSNFGSIDQHFSKDAGNECRTNLRTWTRHQLSRNDISEALTLLITNLDREKIYLYLIRTGGCLSAVKLYFLLYAVFFRLLCYCVWICLNGILLYPMYICICHIPWHETTRDEAADPNFMGPRLWLRVDISDVKEIGGNCGIWGVCFYHVSSVWLALRLEHVEHEVLGCSPREQDEDCWGCSCEMQPRSLHSWLLPR